MRIDHADHGVGKGWYAGQWNWSLDISERVLPIISTWSFTHQGFLEMQHVRKSN
jgi:hypothetical protein